MNYSVPVSSRMSLLQDYRLPSYSFNKNETIHCRVNASQIMWAIAQAGGWSNAEIKHKMIAEVYVVLTLCIFGFIGNAITIAVLRKDPDRAISSTNWLLQTLALVDTIYLASRSHSNTMRDPCENIVLARWRQTLRFMTLLPTA